MARHLRIREQVPLAPYTTLGLGGPARFFAGCRSDADLLEGIHLAKDLNLRLLVLGGGSNVVIADEGFDGLVLKMETRGTLRESTPEGMRLTVAAGERWDDFVCSCIDQGLAGLECLSGIPGSVGATPIQNVGAYGQEVSQTVVEVAVLDVKTGDDVVFRNAECRFAYRQSRFKHEDAERYVVTSVTFLLQPEGRPVIRYPELEKRIAATVDLGALESGAPVLGAVREAVLALRRRKSMVIDQEDPNTRSVGSFFTNPVVPVEAAEKLRSAYPDLPGFPAEGGVKLPAAWLVEHAGFARGYSSGGAAVSDNHCLALVNRGTTSAALLSLAQRITEAVEAKFGIRLEKEPVIVESKR